MFTGNVGHKIHDPVYDARHFDFPQHISLNIIAVAFGMKFQHIQWLAVSGVTANQYTCSIQPNSQRGGGR